MDGKRRQYVPPALSGSSASTTLTSAAVAAAEAAGKRLTSLRSSARPPDSFLPTHPSQGTQVWLDKATRDTSQCTPSTNAEDLPRQFPPSKDGVPFHTATPTEAVSAARGLLRTHTDDSLPLPRPRLYAAPLPASSTTTTKTSSSVAPTASVAAAAAAATLLKIRNQTGSHSTVGIAPLSNPLSSERISLSSLRQLVSRSPLEMQKPWPPSSFSLQRPPSTATSTNRLTGGRHKASHVNSASESHPSQHVFSSPTPIPPLHDAPPSALELYKEVLGLDEDETRCNDLVRSTTVGRAKYKRPRYLALSRISDEEDDDSGDGGEHRGTIAYSPSSSRSSSSSSSLAAKELAPPCMSSTVMTDPLHHLTPGEDMTQAGGECGRVLPAHRTGAPTAPLPRPDEGEVSAAPHTHHSLIHAGSIPNRLPPPDRNLALSSEDVEQTHPDFDTEEGGDTDTDDEAGEDDAVGSRRSVVPSDPLRLAVDWDQVQRIAARATAKAAHALCGEDTVDRSEEEEALFSRAQEEGESQSHAKQNDRANDSFYTDRDACEAGRARGLLEKRAKADIHRRATQAATAPASPAEPLLCLLQHLPTAPGRVIYERNGFPPSSVDSGFDEEFHKCVQKLMTRNVLQRDGRIGDAETSSVSAASASLPYQQHSPATGRRASTQRRRANQKQKDVEIEQAIEFLSRGLPADVRDVVTYARCVVQERLNREEQLQLPKSHSTMSRVAVEASEGVDHPADDEMCARGDALAPDESKSLAALRAVVDQKISLMRATLDHVEQTPVGRRAGSTDAKETLVEAHARFTDVVRRAAASRREKAEAAQLAEQRLEATVDAWRRSYDTLLNRELSRHRVTQRTERRPRIEALLQALQPPQGEPKRPQRHLSHTGPWGRAKGMHRKERKRINKFVEAAANIFPMMPPFQ